MLWRSFFLCFLVKYHLLVNHFHDFSVSIKFFVVVGNFLWKKKNIFQTRIHLLTCSLIHHLFIFFKYLVSHQFTLPYTCYVRCPKSAWLSGRSFIGGLVLVSSVPWFIGSFLLSLTPSTFTKVVVPLLFRSFVRSFFCHSPIHSFLRSCICLIINSFVFRLFLNSSIAPTDSFIF